MKPKITREEYLTQIKRLENYRIEAEQIKKNFTLYCIQVDESIRSKQDELSKLDALITELSKRVDSWKPLFESENSTH